MKPLALLISLLAVTIPCYADTLLVNPDGSAEYSSLSQALSAAQPGDTITLQPGIYRGAQNRSLYYYNGSITIQSEQGPESCIIDCESVSRFIYFSISQDATATLKGLTVINANGGSGNIYLSNGSLVLNDCIVKDCVSTSDGGVIYGSYGTSMTLTRSRFFNNSCQSEGGVLSVWNMPITIDHCIFAGNSSEYEGGAIWAYCYDEGTGLNISCSTFSNNTANSEGGVLSGYFNEDVNIKNCIMADNGDIVMSMYRYEESVNININYCLFSSNSGGLFYDWRYGDTYSTASSLNGAPGCSGNISGQPRFAEDNDFHLLEGSAAIDAGAPTPDTTDLDGLPRQIKGAGNSRTPLQDIGPYEYDPLHPLIVVADSSLVFVRDVNAPNPAPQDFSFRNTTSSPLNWTLTSDTPWLQVSETSGELISARTTVTVSVDSDGLARGVYTAKLTLSDPNAANDPVEIPVSLYIKGKLLVPDQFPTIAEAVYNAMSNEIIEVTGGTYSEGITLDKPLTLIGLQDPNIATYSTAFRIEADDCSVRGFTLSRSGYGLYVTGSNNTIKNLSIAKATTGIFLYNGSDNTLDQIAVSDCTGRGINIQNSPGNALTNVTVSNCTQGFNLTGNTTSDYHQSIDQTNTIDGKPIFYLVGVSDMVIAPTLTAPACVYLVDCTDVVLFRLDISDNGRGVCLVNTSGCTMRSTKISNCDAGVWLMESPNNALMSNTIEACDYGIRLVSSADTDMQRNILTNNNAGFSIVAEDEDQYTQMIDTTNLVNDLPIYYLVNENDMIVDGNEPVACIYAIGCNNLTVSGQTITNNTHGIALINCTNTSVQDNTCRDNVQSNLLVMNCSDITVERCTFTNSQYGIELDESLDVTLTNCTLAHNNTGMLDNYSDYIMTYSMIRNNTTYGGVRHYARSDRQAIFQGCTFFNNSYGSSTYVGNGGAITGSANYLVMQDCILWGNTPGSIPDPDYSDYTMIFCCVQNELPEGSDNITVDPLLTSDGHLTANSPCINAATPARRRITGVDIDGEERRIGNNVDIGADEFLDTDGDELPDWFERELDPNGLAMNPDDDLDGDEYTNLEEYIRFSGGALLPSGIMYVDSENGNDTDPGNDPNAPKRTLQSALSSIDSGERVVLMPGTYNTSISIPVTNALIQSSDPEDPNVVASTLITGYTSVRSEGSNVEFRGLTFTGSMECYSASAILTRCCFTQCYSAPITAMNSSMTLKQCEFTQNHGLTGSVLSQNSTLKMEHCLISDNSIQNGYAHALTLIGEGGTSESELINCTIANNSGTLSSELSGYYGMDHAPAILAYGTTLTVTNSIIWDSNTAIFDLQEDEQASNIWITYSDVSGMGDDQDSDWLGLGNLSVDPGFARLGTQPDGSQVYAPGDYHLLSEAGRWDTALNDWVQDTTTSLCIGAANPGTISNDPNWTGIRHNLGVYGNTPEQSLAPTDWTLLGDLTNDGIVSTLDEDAYSLHASNSRVEAAYLGIHPCDLNRDSSIDALDLQILQTQMGLTTPWYVDGFLNVQWNTPPAFFDTASSAGTSGSSGGSASGGR